MSNWAFTPLILGSKLYPFLVGYVGELKEDLFCITKSDVNGVLQRVAEKYRSEVLASLSSQFPDKEEAVYQYGKKTTREETMLHPACKAPMQFYWSSLNGCISLKIELIYNC